MEQKAKGIGVNQNIFAIIQGGTDKEFRKLSAEQLCALSDYDGFAIGGLSVGEPNADMYETVSGLHNLCQRQTKIFNGCWNT